MPHPRPESPNAPATVAPFRAVGTIRGSGSIPALACAVLLWGVLSWFLSAEWALSEQYNYGWFVPLLAAALFALRWPDRPKAQPPPWRGPGRFATVALGLGLLALIPTFRLVEIANPEWRPLGWAHAMAVVALTLIGLWIAGGRPWLKHFAFPVLFFLVAVPWTRGVEDFVIQQLMRGVAQIAVDVVALLGVPALAEGNLIRVGSGVVGVNEACSGVRSLQTSLMLGLLLGELNRFHPVRRGVMLTGTVGVALLANVFRATYLVWLAASRGLAAVERQHDTIGYLILGTVFLGSLGIAAWLKLGASNPPIAPVDRSESSAGAWPAWALIGIAAWLGMVELGVEGWFRWHERDVATTPRWTIAWPEQSPGFRELPMAENTARILRFDDGRGVIFAAAEGDRPPDRMVYFFRWKPGRNSAQLAADHRPDVCLPASGLRQVSDLGVRVWPVAPDRAGIPFQHFEFARRAGGRDQKLDVFYCLAEDVPRAGLGFNPFVSSGALDHIAKRIRVAFAGRRNLGQQMMEVVLFDAGSAAAAEHEFAALLPTLIRPVPAA